MQTTLEPKIEYRYEWRTIWGECLEASMITTALIVSIAVIISLKITISFILLLKRKKEK